MQCNSLRRWDQGRWLLTLQNRHARQQDVGNTAQGVEQGGPLQIPAAPLNTGVVFEEELSSLEPQCHHLQNGRKVPAPLRLSGDMDTRGKDPESRMTVPNIHLNISRSIT